MVSHRVIPAKQLLIYLNKHNAKCKYLPKYKQIQSCACFFEILKTWEPFLNSLKMCDLNASLPLVHFNWSWVGGEQSKAAPAYLTTLTIEIKQSWSDSPTHPPAWLTVSPQLRAGSEKARFCAWHNSQAALPTLWAEPVILWKAQTGFEKTVTSEDVKNSNSTPWVILTLPGSTFLTYFAKTMKSRHSYI